MAGYEWFRTWVVERSWPGSKLSGPDEFRRCSAGPLASRRIVGGVVKKLVVAILQSDCGHQAQRISPAKFDERVRRLFGTS
jgi:hypothetical protein